jgi:hypothetical protein
MKVGQVVMHEGRRFQVLSVNDTLVLAHSYDKDCGIDTTIYVSTSTGKVIATKAHRRKSRL